jgi:ParB family chromosome partitioning protein
MGQWWKATKTSYFGRVSKALILEAVTEGVSAYAECDLAKLKKEPLASTAEERPASTGWLTAILKAPVEPDVGVEAAAEAAE